ncbi:MAG TPA: LON peptidase substrate-binding domain-containing protein [Candidatus Acidoferrum sp.]|nr:LON peptidase substrate-binding domain-containing protein [Candidatus Acidoferrum sp.]
MRPERIPLFPLNVVLLPGADLPLHIFEPRYLEMTNRCLREESEFGVLLAVPNGVVGVGCTAEILEVTRRNGDGTMDILTTGRAPFRVLELYQENPLAEGQVDYLEDRDSAENAALQHQVIELYETCHTLIFGDYPKEVGGLETVPLSYQVAGALPMDLLWKQQLLELRTEADRQERLAGYLRAWAPHLEKKGVLRQRAGGNGEGLN